MRWSACHSNRSRSNDALTAGGLRTQSRRFDAADLRNELAELKRELDSGELVRAANANESIRIGHTLADLSGYAWPSTLSTRQRQFKNNERIGADSAGVVVKI